MPGFFAFSSNAARARCAVTLLAAALLSACGGDSKAPIAEEPNILPVNYRADLTTAIHRLLEDPTGIRNASIAEPALKPSGSETRYIVCLRFDAKTGAGTYGGLKDRAAFFYAGKLTSIADATREQCGNAPYQPYPELEKLCREIVCPKR